MAHIPRRPMNLRWVRLLPFTIAFIGPDRKIDVRDRAGLALLSERLKFPRPGLGPLEIQLGWSLQSRI
jgi:hypothetical protein